MPRPKLADGELHQNALKIRLKDHEYRKLEEIALRHGIPVAVVARTAVKKLLEEYEENILALGRAA